MREATSAEGLTVSHCIAVVNGSESRLWFYSAMTVARTSTRRLFFLLRHDRGADSNQAPVFTHQAPRTSRRDPSRAGTRAIPAAVRRAGRVPPMTSPFPAHNPDRRDPMAVLTSVIAGETLPPRRDAWRAAMRE